MIPRRLKLLLATLALLVCIAAWRVATRPPVGPGADRYRDALAARDRGESQSAIARLQEAIVAEPDQADYHADLGDLYLEARAYDAAVAEFQTAAFLASQPASAYARLAQCLVELRRRDEVFPLVELALKENPKLALAYAVRGEQRLRDDNLKEALEDFRKTMELEPDFALAYQKAGFILFQTQQYDEALKVLELGLPKNPMDPGTHLLLGQTLLQLGGDARQEARAEQHLRAALMNNPEAHRVHAALGQLYLRQGLLPPARSEFEAALRTSPRLREARYGLAQVAQREGKPKEAARHQAYVAEAQAQQRELNELLAQVMARPEQVAVGLRLARRCLDVGALEDAERALSRIVLAQPDLRAARELRVELFEAQQDRARADRESQIAESLPRATGL